MKFLLLLRNKWIPFTETTKKSIFINYFRIYIFMYIHFLKQTKADQKSGVS